VPKRSERPSRRAVAIGLVVGRKEFAGLQKSPLRREELPQRGCAEEQKVNGKNSGRGRGSEIFAARQESRVSSKCGVYQDFPFEHLLTTS
jgi:hypothetical protein